MNEATRIPANTELGASAEQFQNLHEFVQKARANLNQNAWDYIVGAAETETTMRRNRMASMRLHSVRGCCAMSPGWMPQPRFSAADYACR